jgi:hypothetical protein
MKWLTDGKTFGLTTRVRVGVWAKYWRLRPGCGVPEPLPSRPSGTPASQLRPRAVRLVRMSPFDGTQSNMREGRPALACSAILLSNVAYSDWPAWLTGVSALAAEFREPG